MIMRKIILMFVFAVSTALVFNACSGSEKKATEQNPIPATEQTANVQYTCPMHPEVIKDKPGQCPICGMDLEEKKADTTKM